MRTAIVLAVAMLGLVAAGLYGAYLYFSEPESASPASGPTEISTAAWNSYRVTGNGLVVEKTTDPCTEISDVNVSETAERVVVTVYVESEPGVCNQQAVTRKARVELKQELGSRQLFDGSCLAKDVPERSCVRSG